MRWNLSQGNLPLRSSEASTPEFAAYVKEYPGADVLFANLQNAKTARPTVPGYVEMSRYYGEAVAKVLQGAAGHQDGPRQGCREVQASALRSLIPASRTSAR